MHRSILSAIFVFALAASTSGLAAADETASAIASSGAATEASISATEASASATEASSAPTEASESAAPSGPAASSAADADDAAQPTADADLVMWNAAPAATSAAVPMPGRRVSRLQRLASGIVSRSSAIASSLTRSAMRFIGTPYVFGGTRSTGFDCSGYVQHVFAMLGFHLPRTADAQYDAGHRIAAAMEPGDLVFFHTYAPGVSHVGIYLGKSRFIHSSSSHGVSIASLHDSYWAPRYLGAKRVFSP